MDDVHGSAHYDPATGLLTVRRRFKARPDLVTVYDCVILDSHPSIGSPAVRLTKADGSSFDLLKTRLGWVCECQDFVQRRQAQGLLCKHLKAVLNAGVLNHE